MNAISGDMACIFRSAWVDENAGFVDGEDLSRPPTGTPQEGFEDSYAVASGGGIDVLLHGRIMVFIDGHESIR